MFKRKHILLLLILLTLLFIWGNSLMPASLSSRFSEALQRFLQSISPNLVAGETGHGTLRKVAHGTEYLILGLELWLYLRLALSRPLSFLALSGLGTAFLDETIQLFVPGRSGQLQDVWIDLGGFACGVLLAVLLNVARKKAHFSKGLHL